MRIDLQTLDCTPRRRTPSNHDVQNVHSCDDGEISLVSVLLNTLLSMGALRSAHFQRARLFEGFRAQREISVGRKQSFEVCCVKVSPNAT